MKITPKPGSTFEASIGAKWAVGVRPDPPEPPALEARLYFVALYPIGFAALLNPDIKISRPFNTEGEADDALNNGFEPRGVDRLSGNEALVWAAFQRHSTIDS